MQFNSVKHKINQTVRDFLSIKFEPYKCFIKLISAKIISTNEINHIIRIKKHESYPTVVITRISLQAALNMIIKIKTLKLRKPSQVNLVTNHRSVASYFRYQNDQNLLFIETNKHSLIRVIN